MENQYELTDDGKLQVTVPVAPTVLKYSLEALKEQEARLVKELGEVRELIRRFDTEETEALPIEQAVI